MNKLVIAKYHIKSNNLESARINTSKQLCLHSTKQPQGKQVLLTLLYIIKLTLLYIIKLISNCFKHIVAPQ